MMLERTLGCAAALGSAASWALSSILFRKVGEDVAPAGMNLAKGGIGLLLMGAALLAAGAGGTDGRAFLLLGASGLLGIAVGDTLFFEALMRLGPKLTMIVGLICPALTIALSVVLLGERPSARTWLGMLLTLAGLAVVLWRRGAAEGGRGKLAAGLLFSALSALCMALSVVLAKVGVAGVSALEAAFIRHLWAAAGLALWGTSTGRISGWLRPFREPRLLKLILASAVVVIFGGFCLSMVALKHVDASVAAVLNTTEPLFILPMTAVLLKERTTARELAGAAAAFAGVALIFLR
ncbi:MAG TPA: DMT family transporter [Elusimicrobiota bacterium]|nr:DMT family transporter [Elusimicrobiota bacterium]